MLQKNKSISKKRPFSFFYFDASILYKIFFFVSFLQKELSMNRIVQETIAFHQQIFNSNDINDIREFVRSGRYFGRTFLDEPRVTPANYFGQHDLLSYDLFMKIVFSRGKMISDDTEARQAHIFKMFDVFVEDGRIFRNHIMMWQVLAHLILYYPSFLVIVASHIDAETWRNILDYVILHRSEDLGNVYDEMSMVACLQFNGFAIDENDKRDLTNWLAPFSDVDDVAYNERTAIYVYNTNLDGKVAQESVLAAQGKEFDEDEMQEWAAQDSILAIDLREYNRRTIEIEKRDDVGVIQRNFFNTEITKRFKAALKRLCKKELVEFMLGSSAMDLIGGEIHSHVYSEIAQFAIDCLKNGTLSLFEIIQTIDKIKVSIRNVRRRHETELNRRRSVRVMEREQEE